MEHSFTGMNSPAVPQRGLAAGPVRHRRRTLWLGLAIGALVLIVAGAGTGGYGATRTLSAVGDANLQIGQAWTDTGRIASLLAAPDPTISASSPDSTKAKQEIDDYAIRVDGERKMVQADLSRLRAADSNLQRELQSALTVPFHWLLASERTRIRGVTSAFESGDQILAILRGQLSAASALYDVFGTFDTLTSRLNAQDLTGARALFPVLDQKLAAAQQLAQGANEPPQILQLVGMMMTFSADLKSMLTAVQAQDFDQARAMTSKLEAEVAAVQDVGSPAWEKAVDTYQQTLFAPYVARFTAGWRAAGYTVVLPHPTAGAMPTPA